MSLVGPKLSAQGNQHTRTAKPGITGITQISEGKIQQAGDEESFDLYYLQNYSIWMDIDILVKTIFNGPSPLRTLTDLPE